ncbi:MAG TPA: hypothetical protein PLN02_09745, partial [Azonexus sp.]|nr:hypothetical protein [Azonexus sp.]
IDHCAIGRLLAMAWRLPASVVAAIEHHHDVQPPADKLVAVTHVAEVVVNALDLAAHQKSRVTHLAASACELIGLNWSDDLGYLFGRIEARSHYLTRIFF